jgi:hypothetical protein
LKVTFRKFAGQEEGWQTAAQEAVGVSVPYAAILAYSVTKCNYLIF